MNQYTINDEFGYDKNIQYLNSLIERTLHHEHVNNAIFSIILVGNEEIQEINRTYRNIDRVTDVISFALEDYEDTISLDYRMLGDIYIAVPRMKEQAVTYGHSEERELAFLVVHGLLHLLGYDHTKGEEEEKVMFALQEELLNEEGIKR